MVYFKLVSSRFVLFPFCVFCTFWHHHCSFDKSLYLQHVFSISCLVIAKSNHRIKSRYIIHGWYTARTSDNVTNLHQRIFLHEENDFDTFTLADWDKIDLMLHDGEFPMNAWYLKELGDVLNGSTPPPPCKSAVHAPDGRSWWFIKCMRNHRNRKVNILSHEFNMLERERQRQRI